MTGEALSSLDQQPRTEAHLRALRGTLPEPADRDAWWRSLTTLSQKWAEYSRETFFREAMTDVQDALRNEMAPLLQRIALVTLKPEAFAGRRVRRICDFLTAHGFRIVHANEITYTPLVSREIWRYQWNVATLDRLFLWDLISAQGRALKLTLEDHSPRPEVPASAPARAQRISRSDAADRGNSAERMRVAQPDPQHGARV